MVVHCLRIANNNNTHNKYNMYEIQVIINDMVSYFLTAKSKRRRKNFWISLHNIWIVWAMTWWYFHIVLNFKTENVCVANSPWECERVKELQIH